jgi:hypothetical protein
MGRPSRKKAPETSASSDGHKGCRVSTINSEKGSAMAQFEVSEELRQIYHQLKLGLAHERVNDNNVFALIDMAARYGDKHIEAQLREWQAPCSDDRDLPGEFAPTRGFNRDNVKR